MDNPFYSKTGKPRLNPGQFVIKAATYAKACKIDDLVADAEKSAQQILSQAKSVFDKRFEAGYHDGLAKANEEFAERLTDLSAKSATFLDHIEDQLINTIVAAVRKIMQTSDDEKTIRALAVTAVQSVKESKQMTMRVHPGQCAQVQRIIDELRGLSNVEWIEIVADENLQHNACILETPFGVVDAGLNTQLRRLKDYLKSEFEKERPTK